MTETINVQKDVPTANRRINLRVRQTRGLRPVSVIGYLRALCAFIAYLVKEEVLPHEIMQRKIRIQEPETLPDLVGSLGEIGATHVEERGVCRECVEKGR
jgi:hypothetical protein